MDGVLVIDKPVGPTSHDVVARVRRALGERRVGHTGTLDPGASGVLPLVIGRATRLARFLSAGDKAYDAVIRLGVSTDTGDAQGAPIGPAYAGPLPTRDAVDAALSSFRGRFLQQPPAYSAKKIAGERSYRLARAAARHAQRPAAEARGHEGAPAAAPGEPAAPAAPPRAPAPVPAPVDVTVHSLVILGMDGDRVAVRMDCSAGFYVRSLAHDLGERLGTGAHLASLRRIRSGDYTLSEAVALDIIEGSRDAAAAAVVPPASMLRRLPFVVLTEAGIERARHGCEIRPADLLASSGPPVESAARLDTSAPVEDSVWIRLLAPEGELVALAQQTRTSALLHPSVVLI